MESINSQPRWYAVYTRPGEEDRVEANLRIGNIKTFVPRMKEKRVNRFTGEAFPVVKPLFPRYLFACFEADKMLHKVSYTRGVSSVVRFGDVLSHVDDDVIDILKSQEGKDGCIKIGDEFQPGDRVVIKSGPFRELVGIFQGSVRKQDRVPVLLSVLSRGSRVLIERDLLKKAAA